jgi:hypothetical protein
MMKAEERDEAPEPRAGAFYAALISEQLETERNRKASLEQRGVMVITTAGALVTLLFALGALVSGTEDYTPPSIAKAFLLLALTFFLGASIAALGTNAVRNYSEADVDALQNLLNEQYWKGREEIGERRSAELRLTVLRTARSINEQKAKTLRTAMGAEVAAVVCVASAIAAILIDG